MANKVTGQIRRIDTFGANVTVESGAIYVLAIIATAYSSAKTLTLIDNDDEVLFVIEVPAGGSAQFTPARGMFFPNGIIFDESASDLAANDFVFFYVDEYPS